MTRFALLFGTAPKFAIVAVLGFSIARVARGQSDSPPRGMSPVPLAESSRRARPPVWSADVLDAFFPDARTVLAGARPDYRGVAGNDRPQSPGANAVDVAEAEPQAPAAQWSKLIDAETIETEVKRLAQAVGGSVTTPGPFKGGGYQVCRQQFSVLAVLFAVNAEYDGPVRWQDVAPGLREAFARAGKNTKVGSDQSYSEAVLRKQDLESLIRGARPQAPSAERTAEWGQVSDRPPLMQRLRVAQQEQLSKWLANEREFAAHSEDIRHEAQIIAMLAAVISREGFEYWDDFDYSEYARHLRESATEISAAIELNNFEQARRALDRASKACADCHDGYRG